MRSICKLIGLGLALCGCSQIPNPLDLDTVPDVDKVDAASDLLQNVVNKLDDKVRSREISDAERKANIVRYAEELMAKIDPKTVPPNDYWKYGDMLRTTQRWPEAEEYLGKAVRFAADTDRKVNDTLRLAQAEAMNGKVDQAIKSVESTFSVKDEEAAPILMATLYEVIPAAEGKGKDKQLAELLKGAIACHLRVKVDLNSESGKLFLATRRHHVSRAEAKMAELAASSR